LLLGIFLEHLPIKHRATLQLLVIFPYLHLSGSDLLLSAPSLLSRFWCATQSLYVFIFQDRVGQGAKFYQEFPLVIFS